MTDQAVTEQPRSACPGATAAAAALGSAVDHLLRLQSADGWWQGELETNVTMDAEDLLMREFLGVRTARQTEQSARWIRSQQRQDGSWANFTGGPANPSTTIEAYLALRLAGDRPHDAHLRAARAIILEAGGLPRARVFTHLWLALFGLWDWAELPAVPPELILLPSWVPLNVYDFACWARQTIVPISILAALRPQHPLGFDLDELYADGSPSRGPHEFAAPGPEMDERARLRGKAVLRGLDRGLHAYERRPVPSLRRLALRRAAAWVVARQEADGSWGGIQPPWVYSLMAMHALGRPLDGAVLARGLQGWERFTVVEPSAVGTVRRIEACQSPVWDTALAVVALDDAGLAADHPAMRRSQEWLVAQEVTVAGDWAVRRPGLAPGGWPFEFDNDGHPDIDDTAEVVLALRHVDSPEAVGSARRGVNWVIGMQSSDGGWAAFDADNTRQLAAALPFCDFGAVIDPPSADVTGHVVEMLARSGQASGVPARRGVAWLLEHQEPDGSWFGRWGANHVYGIGAVVPALIAAGEPADGAVVQAAVRWLVVNQNDDGGWGEDLRSYTDPSWVGRGASTPSQTAWALLALEAAGEVRSDAVHAGIVWLVGVQRPDGGWDEPAFTGTGFPGDFYIGYHLYRLVFPVSALARCLRGLR